MKLVSLFAASVAFVASASFAAPAIVTVTAPDSVQGEGLPVWASVCVTNMEVEAGVTAQYKYDEGDWQDITFEQNYSTIFSQRFFNGGEPMVLTVKFHQTASADSVELTYPLDQGQTRFRPRGCTNIENYNFEAADDDSGSRDLVKDAN